MFFQASALTVRGMVNDSTCTSRPENFHLVLFYVIIKHLGFGDDKAKTQSLLNLCKGIHLEEIARDQISLT